MPIFGYNTAKGFWDIPIPDYTFWGHEHSWLLGARLCTCTSAPVESWWAGHGQSRCRWSPSPGNIKPQPDCSLGVAGRPDAAACVSFTLPILRSAV